jgi:hypothetical protein
MGIIVREEYVCDFCGKAIGDGNPMIGRLSLRKAGARGLGRNFEVALHAGCSDTFTRAAAPSPTGRKSAAKA